MGGGGGGVSNIYAHKACGACNLIDNTNIAIKLKVKVANFKKLESEETTLTEL